MGHILAKVELNLKSMKGLILSPGNIFWKQKSGGVVLISSKADFLNLELIEKLSKANHTLLIEDQFDLSLQDEFTQLFKAHEDELLVKEKKEWREKLINLFSKQFAENEFSQFELDQMTWKVFSLVTREQAKLYLDMDINLFKRSLSVATSYTLCAFILGYYSDVFLKNLFTNTFISLMSLEKIDPLPTLKTKLEQIRESESLSHEDKKYLANVYQSKTALLGERYDGSGIQNINKKEMTDLELVFVALCNHYSFDGHEHKSIFNEIKNSNFKCERKVLDLLYKSLGKKENFAQMSA